MPDLATELRGLLDLKQPAPVSSAGCRRKKDAGFGCGAAFFWKAFIINRRLRNFRNYAYLLSCGGEFPFHAQWVRVGAYWGQGAGRNALTRYRAWTAPLRRCAATGCAYRGGSYDHGIER